VPWLKKREAHIYIALEDMYDVNTRYSVVVKSNNVVALDGYRLGLEPLVA
jgi:hypothetical protein